MCTDLFGEVLDVVQVVLALALRDGPLLGDGRYLGVIRGNGPSRAGHRRVAVTAVASELVGELFRAGEHSEHVRLLLQLLSADERTRVVHYWRVPGGGERGMVEIAESAMNGLLPN